MPATSSLAYFIHRLTSPILVLEAIHGLGTARTLMPIFDLLA